MYFLYDLPRLDEQTIKTMTDDEIDKMLEGQLCSICGYSFNGREEKDNAIKSGKRWAHEYCWYWLQVGLADD